MFRYRAVDVWLLLGMTGLFANLWSYHLWYDDLVLVLPALALFRMATGKTYSPNPAVARGLLGALVLTSLAPGGLYLLPQPWSGIYVALQTIVHALCLRRRPQVGPDRDDGHTRACP